MDSHLRAGCLYFLRNGFFHFFIFIFYGGFLFLLFLIFTERSDPHHPSRIGVGVPPTRGRRLTPGLPTTAGTDTSLSARKSRRPRDASPHLDVVVETTLSTRAGSHPCPLLKTTAHWPPDWRRLTARHRRVTPQTLQTLLSPGLTLSLDDLQRYRYYRCGSALVSRVPYLKSGRDSHTLSNLQTFPFTKNGVHKLLVLGGNAR